MVLEFDSSYDLSSNSRVRVRRLLDENVELENKSKKAAQLGVSSDPNTWKQMRENYEAIILEDPFFSEQHDIEYAVWKLHYERIEELCAFNAEIASSGSTTSQTKFPSSNGPDSIIKTRMQFKIFLCEATRFYRDLMVKIRSKYGLPPGCFSDDPGNQVPSSNDVNKSIEVKKGLISCYRCLIYLGDLARYRFLYVENPFTTARHNLIIAFEMSLKDEKVEAGLPKEKASSISEIFKTFSTGFVQLNGILFTRASFETFEEVLSMVKNNLLELLSYGADERYSFGSDAAECRLAIVRLVVILIFTIDDVIRESDNQSYAEILQKVFTAAFEFMGHVVEKCIQLNDPSSSFLLPGILVFVEWLACHQDIALGNESKEKQARARSFFWKNCITFFNKLLSTESKFVYEDEDETCFFGESGNRLALPEDFELRGFVPLLPAPLILDFSRKKSFGSDNGSKEKKARLQRMIAAGKALSKAVWVAEKGIYFDTGGKKFIIGV